MRRGREDTRGVGAGEGGVKRKGENRCLGEETAWRDYG